MLHRTSLPSTQRLLTGSSELHNARLAHKRPVHRGDVGLGLFLGGERRPSVTHWSELSGIISILQDKSDSFRVMGGRVGAPFVHKLITKALSV